MKKVYLFILVLTIMHGPLLSQVPDTILADCDGNSERLYDVLQTKVVLVARTFYDCSASHNQAADFDAFSYAHPNIRIWAPYRRISGPGSCSDINTWKSNYGWDNVFVFHDADKFWPGVYGQEWYQVIHPFTKAIYLYNFPNDAKNKAIQLVNDLSLSVIDHAKLVNTSSAYPNPFSEQTIITFHNPTKLSFSISIYDLAGKLIKNIDGITSNMIEVQKGDMKPGVYFYELSNNDGSLYTGKLVVE